jgi:hypothetical protein
MTGKRTRLVVTFLDSQGRNFGSRAVRKKGEYNVTVIVQNRRVPTGGVCSRLAGSED